MIGLDEARAAAGFDVVVAGAGAAGMAAAVFAALEGLSVLLVERTDFVGGTSALSAATTWVPGSHHAAAVNPADTPEAAARYLDQVVGNHASVALRRAFLDSAPKAIAALEAGSRVRFRPYAQHPDYEQDAEGATMAGRADGSMAVFPHFVLDRAKPGTVCVDATGRRFVNEAVSYHRFGAAMFEAHRTSPTIPCAIITDAVGLKRYGLGMVRMGTRSLAPYLADGYLIEGRSVAELAARLAVPADALAATLAGMTAAAATGTDAEFGRGGSAYDRANGDAGRGLPNPTLGPIDTPPFYAVKLQPGDIGAATGLVIDVDARVLGHEDEPIPGLYACGNEANSIMGGTYPGPGITLGPAITFAYRAIRHLAGAAA